MSDVSGTKNAKMTKKGILLLQRLNFQLPVNLVSVTRYEAVPTFGSRSYRTTFHLSSWSQECEHFRFRGIHIGF